LHLSLWLALKYLNYFVNSAIENQQLSHRAIWVTSHYENSDVIGRCQKIEARLLPKNLLTHISIKISAGE
jgi:hypothetical protein